MEQGTARAGAWPQTVPRSGHGDLARGCEDVGALPVGPGALGEDTAAPGPVHLYALLPHSRRTTLWATTPSSPRRLLTPPDISSSPQAPAALAGDPSPSCCPGEVGGSPAARHLCSLFPSQGFLRAALGTRGILHLAKAPGAQHGADSSKAGEAQVMASQRDWYKCSCSQVHCRDAPPCSCPPLRPTAVQG